MYTIFPKKILEKFFGKFEYLFVNYIMKKVIRLTESDLIRIVKRVIHEDEDGLGLPHPNKKEPYINEEQFFKILNKFKIFNLLLIIFTIISVQ